MRTTAILLFFLTLIAASVVFQFKLVFELNNTSRSTDKIIHDVRTDRRRQSSLKLSPACQPHWNVAVPQHGVVTTKEFYSIHDRRHTLIDFSWNGSLPFSRIYFYHIRKAGGTMIRKYLKKVANYYQIDLKIQENKYALEEVGSYPHTFYVTNLRDPVERSISQFKYEGRWDCQQLVKNASFVPTKLNARKFEEWKETRGFVPSPCNEPFSFTGCAVNCYIQSFSGEGCTTDGWQSEYNLALNRLFRYNLIFIYERFKDMEYIQAIENFFGVEGFNEPSDMFCGWEAHNANRKIPLVVGFQHILLLTRLNKMDIQFYNQLCSCEDNEYIFPRVDIGRFAAHENRLVEE